MSIDLIITAGAIITMDPSRRRVEAVAVERGTGLIKAVGTLDECRAAAPGAKIGRAHV